MASPVTEQRDIKYGITFGNAAATPVFVSTAGLTLNYDGLPLESSVVFEKNPNEREPERMNGKRNATDEDSDVDLKGSNPTASMQVQATIGTGNGSGVQASAGCLDLIAACIFQDVVETNSTPWKKVFNIPTTFPDFSSDAGAFCTLLQDTTISGADEIINSCIAKKVVFSCYPESNEGRLTLDVDWMGRYRAAGTYGTGALSYPTSFTYKHFADLTAVTIGGGAVLCSGFTFTFELDASPKPAGGAGTLGTLNYGLHKWKLTGSIDVEMDSATVALIALEGTNTPSAIQIYWGSATGATSGDVCFDAHVRFLKSPFKGNTNAIRTLNFKGSEKVASTAAKMFTLTMANGISRQAVWTSGFWV